MKRTEESASDSLRSSVSSPGMPKTYFTPSASRHSTKTSEALRSLTGRTLAAGTGPSPRPRAARLRSSAPPRAQRRGAEDEVLAERGRREGAVERVRRSLRELRADRADGHVAAGDR